MIRKTLLLSVSALTIGLAGCSPQPTETANQPPQAQVKTIQSESEKLSQFFADNFETDLKNSPITQTYRGYKWDYDKWDQVTEDAANKKRDRFKSRLNTLNQFDQSELSENEKLSILINQVDLKRRLANDEFRHHTYIMHQFRAHHTTVPSLLINQHSVNSIEDAEAYIGRLIGVKVLFDQVIEQLRIRQELGVFPPKWAYDQMIQASSNVITGNPFQESVDDSTIFKDFQGKVNTLEISNAEKSGLLAKASDALQTSVYPAYQAMIKELQVQRDLSPEGDGVWRLPDGDKWYQNRLEWFTTTDLNSDQVHQIGLENVERIHNAMRDIMKQVKFAGTLQEFFEFMRTDEQFYYPNTDEGREQYMAKAIALIDTIEKKVPDYFGLTPKARMTVKRVEAFREKSAGKAFYQSPPKDGSRPGVYYANLYNMMDMPTYQMEALAYHEGIPGHHMQRSISIELEGVPEFQKYVTFTAYTEGWGLYTEELAKDMGFYEDPYSDFGRLAMELWRACRLVVDTGLHEKQWSREKAIEYLQANTPNPANDAVKAIERYIAMPGQATAYLIGKIKIMELRAWAKEYLGEQFDIKGFHDEILKDGPVPLDILETKIKAWAKRVKQA